MNLFLRCTDPDWQALDTDPDPAKLSRFRVHFTVFLFFVFQFLYLNYFSFFPTMNNEHVDRNLFSLCAESEQALPLIFVESLPGEIGQKLLLSNRAVGRGEAIKQIWGQVYRRFTRLHPGFLLPPSLHSFSGK
jgi:hypothetical protein